MGVILFGIYIVLSIVLTVIGVFIGNIIFFDSILLAVLSGLQLCAARVRILLSISKSFR